MSRRGGRLRAAPASAIAVMGGACLLLATAGGGCQVLAGLTELEAADDGDPCVVSDSCPDDSYCPVSGERAGFCLACGEASEPSSPCSSELCDACVGATNEVCQTDCSLGSCAGTITLDAMTGPVSILCGTECNDAIVQCVGSHRCEVTCSDPTGCANIEVRCAPDGDCALRCENGACEGSPTMQCGDKGCTCEGTATVAVDCGGACACDDGCS